MTDTKSAPAIAATLETYFRMWNETDARERTKLIAAVFTDDGRHVDPAADARGHAALGEMVAGIQDHYPGHVIRQTSGVDTHNNQFRVGWELAAPDGSVVVAGIDAGEVADDGRIRRITGFWGNLPES